MRRASTYLIALRSPTFCDVGVLIPVSVSVRRGLREATFPCEVMWLRLGVLTTTASHRNVAGFRKKSRVRTFRGCPRTGGSGHRTSPWPLGYSCWASASTQALIFNFWRQGWRLHGR